MCILCLQNDFWMCHAILDSTFRNKTTSKLRPLTTVPRVVVFVRFYCTYICILFVSNFVYRNKLYREDVVNCLVMIQPTLFAYSFNGPPEVCVVLYSPITGAFVCAIEMMVFWYCGASFTLLRPTYCLHFYYDYV